MAHQSIDLYGTNRSTATYQSWVVDIITSYLSGETVYVEFKGDRTDIRRTGSIGKIRFTNMQDIIHNGYDHSYLRRGPQRQVLPETLANFQKHKGVLNVSPKFEITWEGRRNAVREAYFYDFYWLKEYEGPTVWKWETPEVSPIKVHDKLNRELAVGDFISYILYHFDNKNNAAGIYYGKITKIDKDGTVWAKNIKLTESDQTAEKAIKDNSLIVQMSKDLMDRLMLARLSF